MPVLVTNKLGTPAGRAAKKKHGGPKRQYRIGPTIRIPRGKNRIIADETFKLYEEQLREDYEKGYIELDNVTPLGQKLPKKPAEEPKKTEAKKAEEEAPKEEVEEEVKEEAPKEEKPKKKRGRKKKKE
jgi:hypothetical protein